MTKLTDMLDRYRKKGTLGMKVGIMGAQTYPGEEGEAPIKVATVGYMNEYGTKTAPARPFFRTAVEKNKDVLPAMAASLLKNNDPETALRLIGEYMVGEFSDSVMTWSDPPNAQSTIDAKGYNAPLRANDKLLRNSFSYEIET